MKLLPQKKVVSPINLFLMVSGFGILFFFLVMLPKHGTEAYRWLVIEHNWNFQFGDYYRPVLVARELDTVYTNGVNIPYSPLSFLLFHLLWKISPQNTDIPWDKWPAYEMYQYSLLIFLMMIVITVVLMAVIIKRCLPDYTDGQTNLFLLLILLSAPFFQGVIERGNLAFLCLVLLLFAACFKDSESKIMRELSLICIAIAAGIKIYPAVFGLLYLKEKRWKEALRLITYGFLFFFLPFLLTGGLSGFLGFLTRIKKLNANFDAKLWTSIRCFLAASCDYLGLAWNLKVAGRVSEIAFALVSIGMAFIDKRGWKSILYLCGIMTLYGPRTFRYNAIFMLIPLVFFLAECARKAKVQKTDYIYALLFALSFTIPVWAINREVDFAVFFPLYLTLLVGVIETLVDFYITQHVKAQQTNGEGTLL